VVPITGLSDAVIQKWLDQSNGGGVLLYPVKDSDPTILTRINEGLSVLQDGKDVASVGI